MWERFGRRSTKRSGRAAALPFGAAVQRVRGRFGRQEGSSQAPTPFGGAVGLGVGAVAIAATIALVLLLRRRRASRQDTSPEEVHEEANEEVSAE